MLVRSRILTATGSPAKTSLVKIKTAPERVSSSKPAALAAFIELLKIELLKIQKVHDGAYHTVRLRTPSEITPLPLISSSRSPTLSEATVLFGPISPRRTTPRRKMVCFSLFMLMVRSASTTRLPLARTATTRPDRLLVTLVAVEAAPLPDKASVEFSPSRFVTPPTLILPGSELMPEPVFKVRAVLTELAFDEVNPWTTTISIVSPTAMAL